MASRDRFLLVACALFLPTLFLSPADAEGDPRPEPAPSSGYSTTCSPDEYKCEDGRCIETWKCSSVSNCDDICANISTCRTGQFECAATKKCIPVGWMCDGDPDCGIHDVTGPDRSDETSEKCIDRTVCPPNYSRCYDSTCVPTELFCNQVTNCPDNSDEWLCAAESSICKKADCSHGCRLTHNGSTCFCPQGEKPDGNKCVDLDECTLDTNCDQICRNTVGSFVCSCVAGYELVNKIHCKAINNPQNEEASLIFSTQRDIRRVKLDGTPWNGNSTLKILNSHALEFNFANRSVCYIHNKVTKSSLSCSSVDDFNIKWLVPVSMFSDLDSIHQIALDWVSGNWYLLDDSREVIVICNSTFNACDILLETEISKPRGIALDPTKGVMFFTKWGHSAPALERSLLNGQSREAIVSRKIVYPYGVAVDIPTATVYWVDTYLDYVEKVDYSGMNRKTIKRGHPVQNLYSVTVFEMNLFVTSWHNQTIIRLNQPDVGDYTVISANISRPYSVHVFHKQRQPEVEHPCRTHNGGCEHFCITAYKNTTNLPYALCTCKPGYKLQGHGECVLVKENTFLIYSKGKPAMIKGISISAKQKHQMIVPITDLNHPVAIDYDLEEQYIYYSDIHKNAIQRQHLDGTGRETLLSPTKLSSHSVPNCEGLAIDRINRLLYWTDTSTNSVNVMLLSNFEKHKTLIYDRSKNPRAIVVEPEYGLMFWSNWYNKQQSTGMIEKAWMDGSHREILVHKDVQYPNGLTIDPLFKKLYWCDLHYHKIERIDFDGKNRVVIKILEETMEAYSLTLHSGYLFWTEYRKGNVKRLSLNNDSVEILAVDNPPLFDIKVYDTMSQSFEESKKCSIPTCEDFCLVTPRGPVCQCSDGMTLSKTGSCIPLKNYTAPSRCYDGKFQCKEGHCIDKKYVCDGDDDCSDGSDEDTNAGGICETVICQGDQFRCDTSRCITHYWVCDGDKDCADGTDEEPVHCRKNTCSGIQFRCKISGRCIPLSWKCDSDSDCGEGDESDEDESCLYPTCTATEFTCDNKNCIQMSYYCDGKNDCRDNSDEKNCSICDKSMIYCAPNNTCLAGSKKCNGIFDCPDHSDELDCSSTINKISPPNTDRHNTFLDKKDKSGICEPNEFHCDNSICIRKEFRCDNRKDCLDGTDEIDCTITPSPTTTVSSIESTTSNICDPPSRRCDNDTKCITPDKLCNDKEDCKDGSDEGLLCDEKMCNTNLDCSHICYNAPEGVVCACPKDLHLQPDGMICSEQHPCSRWGVCSQECQPRKSHYKCVCHDNYRLADDGFTCKSIEEAVPHVIYSNRHELRSIDLHTFIGKPLILSLKNTIALDFFYKGNSSMIFWTDIIDDKIYRGNLVDGSLSNIEVVVQTGLSTAEGLAVDWIAENLYWVESNLDQIEVAKLNGSFRKTLVAGDIESPRAIAVDPRDGLVFWTDWGVSAARIERCTLAGNSRQVVVQVDQLYDGAWPNGITLDYESRRIYWIDARSDSIHTISYEGFNHQIIIREHETMSHPFATALFENHIYWTDWRTNSVVRANKWNGSDVFVLQRTHSQPFDITIMHPSRQPRGGVNPCGNNNGGCSHLCLLDGPNSYQCACPHVMSLSADKKNCIVNEKVLLFSRPNEVRGVDLNLPYHQTIPTISSPQVLSPQQIDFLASTNSIYWSDIQMNEIRKTGLTTGPTQSIIDTGIESAMGFAIDWISELMFFSSTGSMEHISVCNIKGEYTAFIITENLRKVSSLAVNPIQGKLFWGHLKNGVYVIEKSNMDGSGRTVLVSQSTNKDLSMPHSLSMDTQSWRLYWISGSASIQYYDFQKKKAFKVPLPPKSEPSAVVTYFESLYYASNHDSTIHKCDKTTCADDTLLRNNTGNVLSIKIYDSNLQIGNNTCSKNNGGCQHLCLPTGLYTRTCACATGYRPDLSKPDRCIGIEEFIFYSINWEIRGLSLNGDNNTAVLGPISHVSLATSIDFHAVTDYIYWADSDHGTINRIKRDGTGRKLLIEQKEYVENVPTDWLTGLVIDWIAENMYWIDPKQNAIEVARLNGSLRYVVLSNDYETPTALALDPIKGFLFYAGGSLSQRPSTGWIQRAGLDGSQRTVLYNVTTTSMIITDLSLDYEKRKVYWTESGSRLIMQMNYDGSSQSILLDKDLDNPIALTIHNNHMYWVDIINEIGSIKKAPIGNLSNYQILKKGSGDSFKDIQIFSKQRQKGTNPCASPFNGGCAELCLFNGVNATCACPHGNVAADGKRCESYNAFLMYSRIVEIDSIHIYDENNLNAPYPIIKNRDLQNAIGLSFDYASSRLFYSDIQKGSINMVFFNGTGSRIIIEQPGSVEGLAFDRFTNYLYWTCSNHASINKKRLSKELLINNIESNNKSNWENSSYTRVVKLKNSDKPRGIAVDSCQMRVYWTNWNAQNPSIQRVHTDGFGVESIITTDIRMPNALTLDHKAQKLYWADARLDKIERAEYDGSNRVSITKGTPAHPFDLAVYGDFIFWTDWVLHAVVRADKITGLNVARLRKDIQKPMGIVAIAEDTDDCVQNICTIMNGGCSDICTLNAKGKVFCSCFEGRQLTSDGHRCKNSHTSCQVDTDIATFSCSNGGCIPLESTCDGIHHCSDGSDESERYCSTRICSFGFFQCTNNRCIKQALVCNKENDCEDGLDEAHCACDGAFFLCDSGHCISTDMVCDMKADCPDASDEKKCPLTDCLSPSALGGRTPPDYQPLIRCAHTSPCIHPTWVCDGDNDCLDNSDEEYCPKNVTISSNSEDTTCASDHFTCLNNTTCIPLQWRCDGEDDCADSALTPSGISSDEVNCKIQCRPNQFTCNNKECIPASYQCDGSPDCTDGSDEWTHCSNRTCSEDQYRCGDTPRCILKSWLCDGEADCNDGEDESPSAGCELNLCNSKEFQCKNGLCISKSFYCDGDADCGDNSDEPPGCHFECSEDRFTCKNFVCVLNSWVCDGHDDCGDKTDENPDLCSKNLKSISCEKYQFECVNNVCVNETFLCDGSDDCGDFSDEGKCNINECLDPTICAHVCNDLKIGYQCSCLKGYHVSETDKHLCIDNDECLENPCGQICRNTQGSYVCSCQEGFSLMPDKVNCKANSRTPASLIFSNRYYIRTMNLARGDATLLAHNLSNGVALDFDWAGQCIYWSDVTRQISHIKRLCEMNTTNLGGANSNSTYEILHSTTLKNPDGLAVDWIGRNLYWCDKGHDTIEVSLLDGRHRKVLLKNGLQEPRAIALDPKHGNMYWSDWGDNPHIGRAGMDGSNPQIIINSSLGWPNALSISHESKELYFADAKEDYVAVCDLDGKNIRFLFNRAKNPSLNLHHIFAIAVWEGHIYWSDWETKSIERCERHSKLKYLRENLTNNQTNGPLTCKTMVTLVHKPMDIRVYHPFRQRPEPKRTELCEKLNCAGLCLLTPGDDGMLATCACPENFILEEDGRSCKANCTSAHFVCEKTLTCIPFWWRCDTQIDCQDGSDEPESCRAFRCTPGQFQCANEHCIHPTQLCDGTDNCEDGSDELDCDKFTCLSFQIKCKGNDTVSDRCIPANRRCDGTEDCPQGDDEQNCPPKTCSQNHFQCDNGMCIPKAWVCDGDNDCKDKSDETDQCKNRTCPADNFRCKSGRCIPWTWRCDFARDCPNGEDEPPSCSETSSQTCEPTYFKCDNNRCIPGRWHCDYDDDCGDRSDEKNCVPRNCSESEFRCLDGRCIRGSHLCDGEYNCDDRSDELNCNKTCKPNEFQCKILHFCISADWKCDGDTDCADGTDESDCGAVGHPNTCGANMFACSSPHGRCIPEYWQCDGIDDCGDGSDENLEACAQHVCLPDMFRCSNKKCILMQNWCDGVDDCDDGSDEDHSTCMDAGLCGKDQFRCTNGHCIAKNFTCDGEDNCGDMSDEVDCHHSQCSLGTCSQLCVEKIGKPVTCKCVPGYSMLYGSITCTALGDRARLIVSSDADLRILDTHKPGDNSHTQILNKNHSRPGFKIGHHDFLWGPNQSSIFWTDHRFKRIVKLSVDTASITTQAMIAPHIDEHSIELLMSELNDPRGIAIEWVTKRIYWTEGGNYHSSGSIKAATIDGRKHSTLISKLNEPHDIVVNPSTGHMIWSSLGSSPRIERASLSGTNRKILVIRNVKWPTSLALDIPSSRVFWSDPKTSTLESIKIDGTDRRLIKRFNFDEKPNKIAVFEDSIFMSTYYGQNVLKVDKFGRNTPLYLVRGLNKISSMSVIHQYVQDQNLTNPCEKNPCHVSALCLLTSDPVNKSCICPDGLVAGGKSVDTRQSAIKCIIRSTIIVSCSLLCAAGGTCVMTDGVEKCACAPGYTGKRCEHYQCSRRCLHGGTCSNYHGILKCECPPQWTGEQCGTFISNCGEGCLNGGVCKQNDCLCKYPYTGTRCELCGEYTCLNGGTCIANASTSISHRYHCSCMPGWTGQQCETNICNGYCFDNDYCRVNTKGEVECICPPGRSGDRCQEVMCKDFCKNGGVCQVNTDFLTCVCPARYTGKRCEELLCQGANCNTEETSAMPPGEGECDFSTSGDRACMNGGTCTHTAHSVVCRCPQQWGGPYCTSYIGYDNPCTGNCKNNAVCAVNTALSQARCHCMEGWRGDLCGTKDPCWEYCHRDNGICRINYRGEAKCVCLKGFGGPRCMDSPQQLTGEHTRRVWTGIGLSALILLVIFGAAALLVLYKRRCRRPFGHSRLQDNIEINNPMYLQGGPEEDMDPLDRSFVLDSDKNGGHFANPIYDTMYANKGGSSNTGSSVTLAVSGAGQIGGSAVDERAGLLQNTQESDALS